MLSYDIIDNFNKNEILEGKSPKTIAGLSLILSCKLLNDNLYDNKEFHSIFSNKNTLIIDVASKPGGVDFEYAKRNGYKVIHALGIPGKIAPRTAATYMKNIIEKYII